MKVSELRDRYVYSEIIENHIFNKFYNDEILESINEEIKLFIPMQTGEDIDLDIKLYGIIGINLMGYVIYDINSYHYVTSLRKLMKRRTIDDIRQLLVVSNNKSDFVKFKLRY